MLTSCCENRQGIGDLLVHLVTGQIATVKLMENFPILDEEDSLCRARCFDTVRYHDNRLPVIVDRIKESQKFIRRSGIQRTGRFIGKDQLRLCLEHVQRLLSASAHRILHMDICSEAY